MSASTEEDSVRIRRMIDESDKFRAEIFKLTAEGNKFNRERWLMPFIAGASFAAAISGWLSAYLNHR